MKEGKKKKKRDKRHIVLSLSTEEIVELSQSADRIASTLKRCCSNARGVLRIVSILEDFKNAPPKIWSISIIPHFKLLNKTAVERRRGLVVRAARLRCRKPP